MTRGGFFRTAVPTATCTACTWEGRSLKGRTGVLPKAYFTREAHYSVQILRDLLGLEMVTVETLPDGGMDPDDLAGNWPIIATHLRWLWQRWARLLRAPLTRSDELKTKLRGHENYLHLDAALFGGYLPFTDSRRRHRGSERATPQIQDATTRSQFHATSFSVSLHRQDCSLQRSGSLTNSVRCLAVFTTRNIFTKCPVPLPVPETR